MDESTLTGSPAEWYLEQAQQNAANIARLEQLANDADEKARDFAQRGLDADAKYYGGWRDGIRRAIGVLKGNG